MEENKRKCDGCKHLVCRKSNYSVYGSDNAYCEYEKTIRLITLNADKNKDKIETPDWCPILEEEKLRQKIVNGEKLTDGEKRKLLMRLKPSVKWDDIQKDEIYHIPPVLGEKRRDVIITWKGEYSCSLRDLSKTYVATETIYPSSLISRFLIKHKIKKVEVKKPV